MESISNFWRILAHLFSIVDFPEKRIESFRINLPLLFKLTLMAKIKIKTKYLWGIVMILVPLIGAYFNIFTLFLLLPFGLFFKKPK